MTRPRCAVTCPDCGRTRLLLATSVQDRQRRGTWTGRCLPCARKRQQRGYGPGWLGHGDASGRRAG